MIGDAAGERGADELLDVARVGERQAVGDRLADDVGGERRAQAGGDEALLVRVGDVRALGAETLGGRGTAGSGAGISCTAGGIVGQPEAKRARRPGGGVRDRGAVRLRAVEAGGDAARPSRRPRQRAPAAAAISTSWARSPHRARRGASASANGVAWLDQRLDRRRVDRPSAVARSLRASSGVSSA